MTTASRKAAEVNAAVAKIFPDKSLTTTKAYVSVMKTLWRDALGLPEQMLAVWNWDGPDDADECSGKWTALYFDTLVDWIVFGRSKNNTKRNYMNVMNITLKGTVLEPKVERMHKCLCEMVSTQEFMQEQDEKEIRYGMTHEALLTVLDQMKTRLAIHSAFVERRAMTAKERQEGGYEVLFEFLALASMVIQPPLRGEWGDMMIVYDSEHEKYSDRNFVYLGEVDKYIVINKDKVSNRSNHGSENVIRLTQHLASALMISLVLWPRQYVFPKRRDPNKPMVYMPLLLRNMRDPVTDVCMHQGVQLLRSSYITWFYALPGVSLADKKELARQMRHSWETAEASYRKVVTNFLANEQL